METKIYVVAEQILITKIKSKFPYDGKHPTGDFFSYDRSRRLINGRHCITYSITCRNTTYIAKVITAPRILVLGVRGSSDNLISFLFEIIYPYLSQFLALSHITSACSIVFVYGKFTKIIWTNNKTASWH